MSQFYVDVAIVLFGLLLFGMVMWVSEQFEKSRRLKEQQKREGKHTARRAPKW